VTGAVELVLGDSLNIDVEGGDDVLSLYRLNSGELSNLSSSTVDDQ